MGRKQWNASLFSLEIEADLGEFRAGQFVRVAMDIDGERIGRAYSLVNAPGVNPLEIHFNEVPGGPLSPRLSRLDPGERVWVSARASGAFTLDKVPDCDNLWLFATGTALGVYLSMLSTDEPWSRFRKIFLVQGVRHRGDFAYEQVLACLGAKYGGQFSCVRAASRDSGAGIYEGRITSLVQSGRLEQDLQAQISADDSHVMLCGNSAMIAEMRDLLEERGLRRNRASQPGHYTTEQYH